MEHYARLLASIGINRVALNNVNVHSREATLLTTRLHQVERLAEIFRAQGISVLLSVSFASPIVLGGLETSDPLDAEVQDWWSAAADAVYARIPDFGGFVVKADSEGQPGPFAYGRDHADGANLLARALAPHGGEVFWRAFVYDYRQDWRDRGTDRARAAHDHFAPLDGSFDDNVIVQVKHGPMDFQIREAVSPVIGAMPGTRLAVELQVTQEYTGQQKHLCYLAPWWSENLRFPFGDPPPSGRRRRRPSHGSRRGRERCPAGWSGSPTSAPTSSGPATRSHRRTCSPWGGSPGTRSCPRSRSWRSGSRRRSGPIRWSARCCTSCWTSRGSGTRATPPRSGWGSWCGPVITTVPTWTATSTRRGAPTTSRTAMASAWIAASPPAPDSPVCSPSRGPLSTRTCATCPDELLLFFHHVPYTHRLHSGKTVIQHIYDSRADAYEQVLTLRPRWQELDGRVPSALHERVEELLREQERSAEEWRDQLRTYFLPRLRHPRRERATDLVKLPPG